MLFLQVLRFLQMNLVYYCTEVFCILLVILAKYMWSKRRKCAVEGLEGPKRLPLLGNALTVWCKQEDIFENLVECFGKYPSPMRFDIFQHFFLVFKEPAQVEKILSTSSLTYKDDIYEFIKYFDGEGLITASGPKWKKDKRLLSPLLLKRNIGQYFPVMLNHSQVLRRILEHEADRPAFDIQHYLHRAVADIVNETIIGVQTNAQFGELDDFLRCIDRGYQLVHERIVKPWLQVEFLFRLTPKYQELTRARQVIHGFFWKVLHQVQKSHSHLGQKAIPCRTILEQMLDIRDEVPDFSTDEELIHHMTTFYSASEDTATSICSFAVVMLGMYPEYQKRVVDEIRSVIGWEEELCEEHLQRLDELQMVLKETLRLFPIAPLLLRKVSQGVEIGRAICCQ
uniref:Cytochrome P450 n=1 Tax=Dendroctonus armandi TaxID=77159 RepID=A0A0M4HF20_9CUCU|nr:cytochrome P450 [Dendroctonus armandi]